MKVVINKLKIVVISSLFIFGSCASKQQHELNKMKKESSYFPTPKNKNQEELYKNNCSAYTFNYTNKFPEEKDSVTVYGKVTVCSTGKIPEYSTLYIYNQDKILVKKMTVDKSGKYQIKLKKGLYGSIEVESEGANIFVPESYLGLNGSSLNIDLKLLRVYVLY
ncbi:hypothetical protein VJ786_10500 [Sphingobacterium sp. PU5-4]|uniref:Carboxypeptidase regulatory-like domain-containing protein n=1 Tax=Sphingobacterium tenebrionis TaxID=3111775 RepID=A0ABU8I6H6_9SPHI